MTFSDLEWLSEIFNDTKHRSASLQQLSFLFVSESFYMYKDTCIHATLCQFGRASSLRIRRYSSRRESKLRCTACSPPEVGVPYAPVSIFVHIGRAETTEYMVPSESRTGNMCVAIVGRCDAIPRRHSIQ